MTGRLETVQSYSRPQKIDLAPRFEVLTSPPHLAGMTTFWASTRL